LIEHDVAYLAYSQNLHLQGSSNYRPVSNLHLSKVQGFLTAHSMMPIYSVPVRVQAAPPHGDGAVEAVQRSSAGQGPWTSVGFLSPEPDGDI